MSGTGRKAGAEHEDWLGTSAAETPARFPITFSTNVILSADWQLAKRVSSGDLLRKYLGVTCGVIIGHYPVAEII